MKKYKIKFKILLYGFPPISSSYSIDNFELKKDIIKENNILDPMKKENFSTSSYIVSCCYQLKDDDALYYNYFESIDYIEVDVANSMKTKDQISSYIFKKTNTLEKVFSFEKKLRLQFNIRIIFPIIKVEIFTMEETYLNFFLYYQEFPISIGFDHIDLKLFEHNSHHHFNLDSFRALEKENIRFNRAMTYFYESFNSSDCSVRFITLFCSMEAILINSKNNITEKLSDRMSKLLIYGDEEKQIFAYNRIKKLYNIRSKYVHGAKNNIITMDNENELRNFVREILAIYWRYVQNNGLGPIQVIKNLDDNINFDFQTRIFAKYLRTDDYFSTYKEVCEEVAKGIKSGDIIITRKDENVIKEVLCK